MHVAGGRRSPDLMPSLSHAYQRDARVVTIRAQRNRAGAISALFYEFPAGLTKAPTGDRCRGGVLLASLVWVVLQRVMIEVACKQQLRAI